MENRKIILIGKNGSGKSKYLGKNLFHKYLKAEKIELKETEKTSVPVFGNLSIEKGQIIYMHTLALQNSLEDKSQEIFTNIIEKNTKYEIIEPFNNFDNLRELLNAILMDGISRAWQEAKNKSQTDPNVMMDNDRGHIMHLDHVKWGYKYPEFAIDDIDEKVKWFKLNKNITLQNLVGEWKPLLKLLPWNKMNEVLQKIIDDGLGGDFDFGFVNEEYLKSVVSKVIVSEPISTKSSISQIKEYFYKEVVEKILKTTSDTNYNSSFLESKIISRFNELSKKSELPINIEPRIEQNKTITLHFTFNNKKLDFEKLSTGQKTLINIISQIVVNEEINNSKTVCTILEEFDAFLNPENISELIPLFTNLPGTFILTTHNPTTLYLFDKEPKIEFFKIKKEEDEVEKITKIEGQKILLNKARNISINTFDTVTIFTEAPMDAQFLKTQYEQVDNTSDFIFNFVPISPDKRKAGKSKIKYFEEELGPKLPKHIRFVLDYDKVEQEKKGLYVNSERYSLENFVFDPFILREIIPDKWKESMDQKFQKLFGAKELIECFVEVEGKIKSYKLPSKFLNENIKIWASYILEEIQSNMGILILQLELRKILFTSWKNKLETMISEYID